jgi:hypothetical protein
MNDPVVDEVRRIREAHAARFNYDLDAIFRDLKEREKKSGLVFVEGAARQASRTETSEQGQPAAIGAERLHPPSSGSFSG